MDRSNSVISKLRASGTRTVILAVFVLAAAGFAFGQPRTSTPAKTSAGDAFNMKASPAYAELLLRKTELQSELEALLVQYTEDFPRVKELRHMLGLIDRDVSRLAKVKAADSQKLTLALGKLIVKRIELEGEMWKLQLVYSDEHPDLKRAKRRVEIYESAISEVLN